MARQPGDRRARQGHAPWLRQTQGGQVVVLFAISLFVIFSVVGLAVDGGFGLNQLRRAQNAADFASEAGTSQLGPDCNQGSTVPQSTIYDYINAVVNANIPGTPPWTAFYLDKQGAKLPGPVKVSISAGAGANAPATACGIVTTVTPTWGPFIEQIMGVANLTTTASARAVLVAPAGIDSLGRFGLHTIYAGGSGTFIVDGDINDNSGGCTPGTVGNSPFSPSGPCLGVDTYGDTMDAFSSGTIGIYGTINAVDSTPLDPCYSHPNNPGHYPVYSYPTNPPSALPNNAAPQSTFTFQGVTSPCGETGVTRSPKDINYNAINPNASAITNDPLGYLPTPTSSSTICAGGSLNTVGGSPIYNSGAVLNPGEYTGPVVVNGNATFHSCPNGQPGRYIFDQGIEICPQASGQSVASGNAPTDPAGSAFDGGVTLYSAGLFTGVSPDSCPSLGVGQDGDTEAASPNDPDGDSPVMQLTQIVTPGAASPLWPVMNYGITVGGVDGSTVDLQGPGAGDGQWGQVVLFQNRSASSPANIGFDAGYMDGAAVSLTGDVYDASMNSPVVPISSEACNFAPAADGGEVVIGNGSTPTVPGQIACQTQASDAISPSCATNCVVIQGVAVVDSFDTTGSANLLIKPPPPPPGAGDVELVQ
ncbi:MAG TPA: pilus assembly protein TadG-related protein [Verrucomicrobiae bacterium]|nr:pilus assembly protein TadG-related protein [Verrucomicrobiae bacterium]